jgi:hypothetical protein
MGRCDCGAHRALSLLDLALGVTQGLGRRCPGSTNVRRRGVESGGLRLGGRLPIRDPVEPALHAGGGCDAQDELASCASREPWTRRAITPATIATTTAAPTTYKRRLSRTSGTRGGVNCVGPLGTGSPRAGVIGRWIFGGS